MTTRRTVAALLGATMLLAGTAGAGRIEHRKKHQEKRIEKGEKSGKLSPEEAARLRSQEEKVNAEEQAMRDANGGKLSASQRKVVRHQQKRESRRIYRQKHDENAK